MAWQDVYRKYDENGNVVGEVKFNEGTQEYNAAKKARESGGGQVGDWYIKSGTGDITSKISAADRASSLADVYTPQVKVNKTGDGLVLSGSKTAINSELGKQLKKYLDETFKYADLKSANVSDAIDQLNKDIRSQMEERIVSGGLGMDYNDYKEYRTTMQQFESTNPLKTTAAIPGYGKNGKEYKTISDWLTYYQNKYTPTERANLYLKSLEAMQDGDTDPVMWTPYLVMTGGNKGSEPKYGFSTADRLAVGWESFLNDVSAKLVEGTTKGATRLAQYLTNSQGYLRKDNLNNIARELELGRDVKSSDVKWMSEQAFNKKLDSIIGKRLGELDSSEKTFLATAVADRLGNAENPLDAFSEDGAVTDKVRDVASYDNYINGRDNLSTTEKYDEAVDERIADLERGRNWLQKDINAGTLYAPAEITIGSFAGTMLRMWAEAGLINFVTGGAFNPAALSDSIASKVVQLVSGTPSVKNAYNAGLTLGSALNATQASSNALLRAFQTPVGSFLLSVAAELPEDVVQTVIDDVLIGQAEDIPLLAPTGDAGKDMAKLGESFAQNLAFRLAFTPIHVGAQKVRQWSAIKNAARELGLDATVSDQLFLKNQQLKDAADAGNIIDVTENSATVRNPDGTETVLDNVAMLHFGTDAELQERYPAVYEMLRKKGIISEDTVDEETAKIFDDPDEMEAALRKRESIPEEDLEKAANLNKYFEDYETKRIDDVAEVDSIIDNNIPQTVQRGWYADSGEILRAPEGREVMAIAALRNTDLRNAALNKAYDVYYRINQDAAPLSFDEWVNTPITLYRRSFAGDGVGDERANFLSYSMKEGGLSEKGHGTEIDTITIAPKDTTGLLMGADSLANKFADEGEVFVPTAIIEGHPKYLSVGDIVDTKNAENNATMDAVPSSASYRWESPDVTKTYTSAKEVFADRPVGKNMTEVKQWQKNAEAYFMNRYVERAAPAFTEKYPTIDEQQQFVRNMDYLFDLQRRGGESLEAAKIQKMPETNVEVDKYGVKVKRVKIGEYDNVPLDFEIADRVAKLNELGYETHNSHSGIGADHQKPSDAGGGYLDFEGSMSPEKKAAIERAAKKAGMGVHESRNPLYPRTDFVVRQSNTADGIKSEDVIKMANAETVSRYGLDPENWVDDALKKGILSEALDYRGEAEKRIYVEHGGYAQPDDASRRASWDTFFKELGIEKEPDYEISGSAIGKTYENEGITYTVNEDDVRFYLGTIEPIMKDLREAGAAGQGKEAFTITGYLPHSDYDPTLLTAEDSMQQGVLWREYTGSSTTAEDGSFSTGWLNPDLEARYRTFVNNMLWDSLGDEVIVAKYMEEFNADGLNVAANVVEQLVGGRRRLAHLVSQSDSIKAVVKNLTASGEFPTNEALEEAAAKLGATDAIHNLYSPIYGESAGLNQRGNVSLMSKSDWMRSLTTGDGSLYDNGGAMMVNGSADAKFMAKRIFEAVENNEQIDVHNMFVEYLTQNRRRTAKGASYIADKWMSKIAQKASNGGISRRALTAELGTLIYNEGANRVFRFIGRMDTSKLNGSNRKAMDSLLFRHSAISKVINTSGFSAKLNQATNKLISARMKSLFWLNFKNAVLQSSECIRLFTEFDLGDALDTIKALSGDEAFRKEVAEWVDMLVPERYIKGDTKAQVDAAATIAKNSSVSNGELTVNKLPQSDLNSISKSFDEFASAPVEMGESLKNTVIMAGILKEAKKKGLSGNELFSYVNQRFERIGIAANEMGRLNASDNPLFRLGANLKTFQIRQLSMFLNNIHDMNGSGEAVTYILKNLGWKAGLAVVMAKLGYSAAATLGIDPFDLMDDDYTGVDEENYTGLDIMMLSPAGKLFLSGGFTGYINDLYWASRKAYEDSASVTEETENRLDKGFWPGMAMPGTSFDDVLKSFTGFIPGYTAGNRVVQMNELMDTGWAISGTGNQMYTAPENPLEIASGYIFGRSNTPNARAYYQTPDYLQGFLENGIEGVGQQINRELFGQYRQFDPIDTKNYTDWFNGTANDEQQWNSGYYYFLNKVRQMNEEYSKTLTGYTKDEDKTALKESYNRRLAEIGDQLGRFTAAYESKHPEGIDSRKMKNLINVLNIYQPVMSDTEEEAKQRSMDAYSDALYRYTQAGLPAVTSYKKDEETGEIEPVYSPQYRSALQGQFGLPEEAATQIKQLYNDKWKKLNQQYRDRYYNTKGSKAKKAIQNEYISIVRQDLDPIVQLYGGNIWSNEEVENIIDDVFNSMIPKYGQTAKSYLKNLYKDYGSNIRYNEKGNETLAQVNQLLDQGKTARAKALARTLLQRVQENRTSLSRTEMERLQEILK